MLTPFQKSLLGVVGAGAFLIAVAIAAAGVARAAGATTVVVSGQNGPAPGVVTTGEGTVAVRPDIALLGVGVVAQAATAADAQAQLAQRMAVVIERAKQLGIADADLVTSGYSIHPMYAHDRGDSPRITGYQASQHLSLTYRDVDAVGAALDALVQNDGATNVSIAFGLDDPKAAQAEARRLAIEDARSKAGAMASAAGVSLGRPLSITESGGGGIPFRTLDQAGAEQVGTQIPVGELDIVIHVQVQFGID
ncbi:MAG TPA: SIMPL domain-containing protein [Candidatus Limnocylindrales bacterium]|nr:SIMPL domain-containing protein [Candidatus Limnocylindrales bacterium]